MVQVVESVSWMNNVSSCVHWEGDQRDKGWNVLIITATPRGSDRPRGDSFLFNWELLALKVLLRNTSFTKLKDPNILIH